MTLSTLRSVVRPISSTSLGAAAIGLAIGSLLASITPLAHAQQEVDSATAEACKLAMRAHVMRNDRNAQRVDFEANSTRFVGSKGNERRIEGSGDYDVYGGAPRHFNYTCIYNARYNQVTRVSFDR